MRIAITGGICDGKTTVAGYIRDCGFAVLDADIVVREIYAESRVRAKIRKELAEEAVAEGGINRAWLRKAVTESASVRRKLNSIVHRPVIDRVVSWMDGLSGHSFVELPLLIETATQGLFDRVWVVMAGRDEQLRRLSAKLKGNAQLAERLLATQLPTEAKAAFSDRLIRTNQPPETVRVLVTQLVEELG